MDLFDHAKDQYLEKSAPLAARMRPRTLEEFVGQAAILGPGRLLRRAIQADQLNSLIFFGPPGTGKTTLARIIANTTRAHFTALNAVLAGVADLRKAVAEAETRLAQHGQRTILFVDEVHRFNKSQQDALLPHVENGTVVLIGATTENPYFEVNKAVLSRSRIFELKSLREEDVAQVLRQALADATRGFGGQGIELSPEAEAHLARVANGDARAALNALELAVETTAPDADGVRRIGLEVAEESIQRKAVLYDKDGDVHFDAVSAFIKSMRGSDPDAALYWMARMVYGGEDPRFVFRRMIIFAAEDVGLADPSALRVVTAAAQAFDYVGMPEGRFHLSEACLYLATAPKSNSTMAFFDAMKAVEAEQAQEVPDHLKDGNRDAQGLGHGQGYMYPHAFQDHWVAQQYLPDGLQGRVFYQPSTQGFEGGVRDRVEQLREAQLAALQEPEEALQTHLVGSPEPAAGGGPPGALARSGQGRRGAEWQARSESALGLHLGAVRERLFALAEVGRQHLVLDANAAGGLLVWEALRHAREGGVWARVADAAQSRAIEDEAALHEELERPVLVQGTLDELPALLAAHPAAEHTVLAFDRVLLRGGLGRHADKAGRLAVLAGLLAPGGRLVIAEPVPRLGERLLAALRGPLEASGLGPQIAQAALDAEADLYEDAEDPMVNWGEEDLAAWCAAAGLRVRKQERLVSHLEVRLGPAQVQRWFGTANGGGASQGRLAQRLGPHAATVRTHLETVLSGQALRRRTVLALLSAVAPGA